MADLLENLEDQWREGNDVHVDTLDVYFLEVSPSFSGPRFGLPPRLLLSPLLFPLL
jgi:hypothetical protein